MLEYRLIYQTKVFVQRGGIRKLPALLKDAGYKKPCLVFDKGVEQTPIIPAITAILERAGISYHTYNKVTPDPTSDIVDEGARIHKSGSCDCIIAIGGGSAMDTAKGINVMCHNEGSILDYAGLTTTSNPASGLICIPTTSGTGSEISNWMVISDLKTGTKHPINVSNALCEYALLDPELTIGLPPQVTAATGMDVFCHAFEGYTTTSSNVATDMVCEKIMEMVIRALPQAVCDGTNIKAREQMMIASSYGGWMLVDNLVHIPHSIGHEIGAAFHIPHGAACAYALPGAMKHIASAVPDKIKYTGELLGASFHGTETVDEIADKTVQAFIRFRDTLCNLKPLSSYKPDLSKVNLSMAEAILKDPITSLTPEPVELSDVMVMLYKMFV